MILGLGCDIVNVQRIEKSADFLTHFKQKILGNDELKELEQRRIDNERELACVLAKYYAGKEAFAKALGSGFIDGIFLKDIQVLHDELGKPHLSVRGNAAAYLQKMSKTAHLHISLSDDYPLAQAIVIIEN